MPACLSFCLSVCLSATDFAADATGHPSGSISENVLIVLYTCNCFLSWHGYFVCVCVFLCVSHLMGREKLCVFFPSTFSIVCLSASLTVCLPACPFLPPSVPPSLPAYLNACLPACLSVGLSVYLQACDIWFLSDIYRDHDFCFCRRLHVFDMTLHLRMIDGRTGHAVERVGGN